MFHCVASATLDRSEWLSEVLRDLGLSEPPIVRKLDRLTLIVREPGERLADSPSQCQGIGDASISGLVLAHVRGWPLPLAQARLMRTAAQQVYRTISSDPHEPPRDSPSLGVIRVSAIPRAEKCVLQDLSSQLRITDDAQRERKDEASIADIQHLEGGLVSEPHSLQQLEVGRLLEARASRSAASHTHAYEVTPSAGWAKRSRSDGHGHCVGRCMAASV